ncbi:MAG: hypothetical protein RXR32_03580 [Candidatus Micrarchaeota archaeon]
MPNLELSIESNPQELIAFRRNELDVKLKFTLSDVDPSSSYWVETLVEVEPPISLAPDRSLKLGKINVGILSNGAVKEKRFKIFSNNDIYPDTFQIKITTLIYDSDGAVADRKEVKYDITCINKGEKDGKVL